MPLADKPRRRARLLWLRRRMWRWLETESKRQGRSPTLILEDAVRASPDYPDNLRRLDLRDIRREQRQKGGTHAP